MSGNMFCKQQGWFQATTSQTGTVNDICCSGVSKTCTGGLQDDVTYNCTTYGGLTGAEAKNRKGFKDENIAIHACNSDQEKCKGKIFELSKTNKKVTIKPETLNMNPDVSCTYLVKVAAGTCGAPTINIGKDNTMLEADMHVLVTEWSEETMTLGGYFPKDTTGNQYSKWPSKDTITAVEDDQKIFSPVELGMRQDKTGTYKRNFSGSFMLDDMERKRQEINAFNTLMKEYNQDVANWDKSLDISNNFVNWQNMGLVRPKQDDSKKFTPPRRPDMPYRPKDYTGPQFTNTVPVQGWGKPSSYMYELKKGGDLQLDPNGKQFFYRRNHYKNFGVNGFSERRDLSVKEILPTINAARTGYDCKSSSLAITLIPSENFVANGGRVKILELEVEVDDDVKDWQVIDRTLVKVPVGPM